MTLDAGVLDTAVTLNALRFRYLDWGVPAADAQAMICLHGFTSHAQLGRTGPGHARAVSGAGL